MLTNPPPSSGGILIAFALELLERTGRPPGVEDIVTAMEAAQSERTEEFAAGLYDEGFAGRFLAADRLGSTTHITAVDGDSMCASVTCSNGTGSGLIVPGTGVHVNNMLGEQDLNPLGFHRHEPGRRLPSMMSPTIVMRDGELEAGLGSGGSNRIRSAVLQTIVRLCEGLDVADAVIAPRVHFEDGAVQAEPGTRRGGAHPARAARLRGRPLAGSQRLLRRRARRRPRPRHGRVPRRRRSTARRRGRSGVALATPSVIDRHRTAMPGV